MFRLGLAAGPRREPAAIVPRADRWNLGLRVIHRQTGRWEPVLGRQSERSDDFHAERAYSVNETDKTITTRTEGSTFPNSEGEEQKRIITRLTADELIYENPVTTRGDRVEAVWKRVK